MCTLTQRLRLPFSLRFATATLAARRLFDCVTVAFCRTATQDRQPSTYRSWPNATSAHSALASLLHCLLHCSTLQLLSTHRRQLLAWHTTLDSVHLPLPLCGDYQLAGRLSVLLTAVCCRPSHQLPLCFVLSQPWSITHVLHSTQAIGSLRSAMLLL